MRTIVLIKIGGIRCIIEVDESKFLMRKFNVGRVLKYPWVIGGVNIGTDDVLFRVVLFINRETIVSVLQECVEFGTAIITDCWRVYINLEELGYNYMTVYHSRHFIDARTGANSYSFKINGLFSKTNFVLDILLLNMICA